MRTYYVYILANGRNGTLYVGVTGNLIKRMDEHRAGNGGFTAKYNVKQLVYYEEIDSPGVAIAREKQLKNWHRSWKLGLVESLNPEWEDLTIKL